MTLPLISFALACDPPPQQPAEAAERPPATKTMDLTQAKTDIEKELIAKHGEAQRARLHRGIDQVARLWRAEDGDLAEFVRTQFISDEKQLESTFARYESMFEQLDGYFNALGRELRTPTDLDVGPMLGVDSMFAAFDPGSHLNEDLFNNKIAFIAILNFPQTTLEEKIANAKNYSRRDWAEQRLTGRFSRRVPGDVLQEQTKAASAGDLYIAEYNVWMHHLLNEKNERLFKKGLRLISHWNLRDELKADYADKGGTDKQRMIVQVMSRIVTQTIPAAVIDNPHVDWNPFTNQVTNAPAEEIEEDSPKKDRLPASADPEPNTRYAKLLANFQASRKVDPYSPVAPTQIARAFEQGREIPEARVKAMFTEVLESPLVKDVAAEIEKRLGRKLEPQDLWYNGFQPRGKFNEAQLDAIVKKKYPTREAFAADIPRILRDLGFAEDKARFLSEHVIVDPSRGAGHALQAARRGDFPHLRTRIEKDGMNYKGYNIAVHELGHNIEQVFSLYEVDHTLLSGVPNNAFTEALAFVFQARDLELLGLSKPDKESDRLRVLNDFWQTWEIAGVALVDTAAWHWMYEHPNATPAELRDAVVAISKEIWNKYYAPVLGAPDSVLLGIYSHMIAYPMYLPDYPIGHLIAFQIEEQVKKSGKLGEEFERMAKQGCVIPDVWMIGASGHPVEPGPLLRATKEALTR